MRSVTNEVNTAFAVNAGNLEITDSNGTLSVPVSSLGTDDQNISGSGLAGTDLTIGIEGGTSETIDLSSLVGTDDQNLSTTGAAGNITIEDGNTININVDDADASVTNEVNTAFAVNAGNLEITDSNGTLSVPVSSLGTDDQNLTLATNTLSIEDGNSVDLLPYLDNTDDQNISGSGLAGTDLTIGIEGGTSETIDLSSLVGTDDQNLSTTGAAGNITIEDGNTININVDDADASVTNEVNTAFAVNAGNLEITDSNGTLSVPVSSLGTDDQNISGSGLAGTDLTIGIEGGTSETIDLSSLVGTDDQNISGSGLAGTDLTIGIEGGTSETIDLSSLVGTDDQNLTLATNTLSIEDGNSVDLSPYLDNTDDQNISGSGLAGTDLTIGIEGGTSETIDLSSLVGTDDQNISGSGLSGTVLTIGIEGGTSETVDLASIDTDTDDQTLSIVGDQLSIADGNTVTIPTADGSETIVNGGGINVVTGSGTSGDPYVVTGTEVDGSVTNEVNTAFAVNAGNLEITDSNGTLSVPVSSLGTDDQNIQGLAVDTGTNILTVGIENGSGQTVDLSHLDDSGTDDQYDDEVLLRTPIDVDEGGAAAPTNETTVEEVIQAMAPITAKAARIFYPPSIAVDASTNGSFTVDLYAQYIAQFGSPTVASSGAPLTVPTYAANELYYYVTYADPAVFNTATMSIDANGVLSYDIIGQPADYNSLINVVFVVK